MINNVEDYIEIIKNKNYTFKNILKLRDLIKDFSIFKNEFKKLISSKNNSFKNYEIFLDDIIKNWDYKFIKKGEFLFKHGDIADNMYIILKGKCYLYILPKNKNEFLKKFNPSLSNQEITEIKRFKYILKNKKNNLNKKIIEIYNYYSNKNDLKSFIIIYKAYLNGILKSSDILFLFKNDIYKYLNYKYGTEDTSNLVFIKKKFKTYYEGSYFGDLNLDGATTYRLGSIVAKMDTYWISLNKNYINNNFIKINRNELIIFLKENFTFLSYNDIYKVSLFFNPVFYKKKKLLFRKNEKINYIYILIDGEIELYDNRKFNLKKVERSILIWVNKQFIGIKDYFSNKKYIYNCKVYSLKCKLFEIELNQFEILIKNKYLYAHFCKINDVKEIYLKGRNELIFNKKTINYTSKQNNLNTNNIKLIKNRNIILKNHDFKKYEEILKFKKKLILNKSIEKKNHSFINLIDNKPIKKKYKLTKSFEKPKVKKILTKIFIKSLNLKNGLNLKIH